MQRDDMSTVATEKTCFDVDASLCRENGRRALSLKSAICEVRCYKKFKSADERVGVMKFRQIATE